MSKRDNNINPLKLYGTEFSMFIEDISFPHVFNYRSAVIVKGDNCDDFIKLLKVKRNYPSDIFDTLQYSIMDLILYGETYIEIEVISDDSIIKEINIHKCKKDKKNMDAKKIIKVKYPKPLQNKKLRRKLLRDFKNVPSVLKTSELIQENIPYNLDNFIDVRDKKLATITGDLYWNARGLFQEKITFAYDLFREINSRIAQIVFIDTILHKINEELVGIGKNFGFHNWFEPNYIVSKEELLQLIDNIKVGTMQLGEIHKKIFSRLYI